MTLRFQRLSSSIPAILYNDSFNEGRYNQPYTGGDWNQYQQGRNERAWNESVLNENNNSKPNYGGNNYGGGTGGGGGSALGWVVIFIFFVPLLVTAAVSSLVMAAILKLYLPGNDPAGGRFTYGNAYGVVFKSSLLYQVLSALIMLAVYWALKKNMQLPLLDSSLLERGDISALISAFLFYQLPAVLLTALMLRRKLSDHVSFQGLAGYIRAIIFIAIIMMPLVIAANYGIIWAYKYYMLKVHHHYF